MSARSALTVVGQAVGAYFGGSWGAAVGGMIGGAIGGAIDGPQRNTQALIDDLNAIKFDYGSAWPRIYGRYRFKISPMWTSTKRPVEHDEEVSSKGGPDAVNTTFTYEQDWLCWAPLGATGFSRVWINGELRYTVLDGSSESSLLASTKTTAWRSITFFDGNAAQMPWAVYEASVGTENAVAFRHRPSLAIEALDLGGSGQPPLIEVEYFTSATSSTLKVIETVYEYTPSIGGFDSGIASYIGPGHTWYLPQFDNTYTNRDYQAISQIALAPFFQVADASLPALGAPSLPGVSSVNFMNGQSDASFWVAVGNDGFGTIKMQTSLGETYTTAPFINALGYSHAQGATLFLIGGGTPSICLAGAAASTAYVPRSAAKFAGNWYVLPETSDGFIHIYKGDDLTSLGSIADPRSFGGTQGALTTDLITGELFMLKGDALLRWGGAAWQSYLTSLPSALQGMGSSYPTGINVSGGDLYSINRVSSSPYTYRVSRCSSVTTYGPDSVSLADIVRSEALLEWSGEVGALTETDLDLTELATTFVTGFATTGSPRESLAQLMDVFYVGCVCSDKLYFRLRGAAAIDTVAFDHSGMAVGQPGEPFTGVERGNDLEVAIQVAVTGPNLLSDYEPGTEDSDRLVGESVELKRYTTPVVFTPEERKGRADTMVLDGRVASHSAQISLDDRHVEKEPFDVWLQLDDQGNLYRVRADRETFGDGVHAFDVVLDDASVLSTVGITTGRDTRAVTVLAPQDTFAVPLDMPILRDADDARGIYVAAKPVATGRWAGWSWLSSPDNVVYSRLGGGTKSTVIGLCSVVPGAWAGGRVFDEVDSIVVDVGAGTLTSSTREALLADQTVNAFAIGAHGRWLLGQFRNAALLSPGVYKLTGLLLGGRGTEHLIGTQIVGDTFVLLKPTGGVVRIAQAAGDLGVARFVKAVTTGNSIDSGLGASFTEQEVGLRPFSPVYPRPFRSAGDLVLGWTRRTRLAAVLAGPSGPLFPLGEETEAYEVDVFADDTFTTVLRTLGASVPSVTYTAAAQTADFGSAQALVHVQIHQLSALVGRGVPLRASL